MDYALLRAVNSPADVRALSDDALTELAAQIRSFLIENVTRSGGHLASNLGVVELTLALHRVLDLPRDRILWDVGHQSYVHKLLTGRREGFAHLREPGGLSGFSRPEESVFDPFVAGHASTSLSAAMGMARADVLAGEARTTVAVVGDGAFSGGMIHEALNNCAPDLRLIIVLNENEMAIGKTTGRFAAYLNRIRTRASWHRFKRHTIRFLTHVPLVGKPLYRAVVRCKTALKAAVYGSNLYEEMGFYYMGPYDGHDRAALERALAEAKLRESPVIVHVKTVKGKGYEPAESEPGRFHSLYAHPCAGPTFSATMGEHLTQMAARDERVCAITAAMADGTGLLPFAQTHPERFFDVGIAEEHAVTFAAGLAAGGRRPRVCIYSTFLQRAYDQILHDVCLPRLPVTFLVDRAGLAPADGPTHHGVFDVSFLSSMPGMRVYAPATPASLAARMDAAAEADSPVAIRYPHGCAPAEDLSAFFPEGEEMVAPVRTDSREESDGALVTYGTTVSLALRVRQILGARGIRCRVILLEQVAPAAEVLPALTAALPASGPVLFLEEGVLEGGAAVRFGAALSSVSPDLAGRFLPVAIRDPFAVPDAPGDLWAFHGLDPETVARTFASAL